MTNQTIFTHKEGTCFLGRTLELSTGFLTLAVTLDVGPRIISLSKKGGAELMFQDKTDAVHKDISHIYGKQAMWHIYGGHRMWLSPEEDATYYPDNALVAYKITKTGAVFTPILWEGVEMQLSLCIDFVSENTIRLTQTAINKGQTTRRFALWGLTVMQTGGTLTVPLETKNTGYLANRNLVFWPYSSIKDERFSLSDDTLTLKSNHTATTPFKVGLYKENLTARYELKDTVFTKTLLSPPADYPDYQCCFETYTSNLIHEVECLSPLKTLKKGEKVTLEEQWELH